MVKHNDRQYVAVCGVNSTDHSALPPGRLFCFGLGYTGARLARSLHAAGWQVSGTARDADVLRGLATDGISGGSLDDAVIPPGTSHMLCTVPPGESGDPVILSHAKNITAAERLVWLGYLSTTGVYGDRGGETVDETDAPAPGNARSRRRLAAEQAWLDLGCAYGVPVHIFRLAGIYGPGRNVLDSVRAGTARRIDKPGHRFSRIHVDDIVQTLVASMSKPRAGAIYNVCDDEAAEPAAVVAHACDLLGIAPPPLQKFDAGALSAMAQSFWAENRGVWNGRIKRELGVTLAYPDYRAGLAALLAAEPQKTK
ncbi:MAG: SDR family oxidoreductase [Proteobacteria bacterium]|nr:SDR family oxidoreductase [Pseudomonadota bacterium]MDA1354720.1 SDR family oxidoreductase [Pseudomonadota bacterium]